MDATDRKLIEAAGKAAGENFDVDRNPLERDDLALRLAVKLGMVIAIDADNNQVAAVAADDAAGLEKMQPEPYAATRRAICMAAAKLGEDLTG